MVTRPEPLYCTHCEQVIDPAKAVWMELNSRTNQWRPDDLAKDGEDWGDDSQGSFPFGRKCADNILAAQKEAA